MQTRKIKQKKRYMQAKKDRNDIEVKHKSKIKTLIKFKEIETYGKIGWENITKKLKEH